MGLAKGHLEVVLAKDLYASMGLGKGLM